MLPLFDDAEQPRDEEIRPGVFFLHGFALTNEKQLLMELEAITARAPFRHMVTPGGHTMSVAMTNCGPLGWVTDRRGYRYTSIDPESGQPWPALPEVFLTLARSTAEHAGFADFQPDACLINRYEPGAKMSPHQDKDEQDMSQPIVSVSLGLPATFLFGGLTRAEKPLLLPLQHGDVIVWGGPARLAYHGIQPLKAGSHPVLGAARVNLTFRKAQ